MASRLHALEVSDLSKSFGGQRVLRDAALCVAPGEIHALVGQNGSGKSTLIKILAGIHATDHNVEGTLFGRPFTPGSASGTHELGLRFVHQDLGLIAALDVTENLAIGTGFPTSRLGRVRWRDARRSARLRCEKAGLDVDPDTMVSTLGLADRTLLAIARILPVADDKRLMIVLDEPTAALPSREVDRLFDTMRILQQAGHGQLIVSHHIDEISSISDRLTVLRDGRVVACQPTQELDHGEIVRLIVGHEISESEATASSFDSSVVKNMCTMSHIEGDTVIDFSAHVNEGEIIGIAGLSGSGRESIISLINGRLPREGVIKVGDSIVEPADPRAALAAGLAWVTGERSRYGLFPNLSVLRNLTISDLRRHTRHGVIQSRSEYAEAEDWIVDLGIVARGANAPILSLSGGNQQKVLVARALRLAPSVLLLDDPTAGIDVAAREQVHTILENAARDPNRKTAVIIASTDSSELARLCHRVVVFFRGRIIRELVAGDDLTESEIDHAQLALSEAS